MKENLTTLKAQLGTIPSVEDLKKGLILEYESLLGPLTPARLNGDVLSLMKNLDNKFSTEKWLFQRVPKTEGRNVKIREGVMLYHRIFSSDKWEIEMNLEVRDDKISDLELVKIHNFKAPADDIKAAMSGQIFAEKEILNILNDLNKTSN